MAGIPYEIVGTGAFIASPVTLLVIAPIAVVVYAAIFPWPMPLIGSAGKGTGPRECPAVIK